MLKTLCAMNSRRTSFVLFELHKMKEKHSEKQENTQDGHSLLRYLFVNFVTFYRRRLMMKMSRGQLMLTITMPKNKWGPQRQWRLKKKMASLKDY